MWIVLTTTIMALSISTVSAAGELLRAAGRRNPCWAAPRKKRHVRAGGGAPEEHKGGWAARTTHRNTSAPCRMFYIGVLGAPGQRGPDARVCRRAGGRGGAPLPRTTSMSRKMNAGAMMTINSNRLCCHSLSPRRAKRANAVVGWLDDWMGFRVGGWPGGCDGRVVRREGGGAAATRPWIERMSANPVIGGNTVRHCAAPFRNT